MGRKRRLLRGPNKRRKTAGAPAPATTAAGGGAHRPETSIQWWRAEQPAGAGEGRSLLGNLLRLDMDVFEAEHWLRGPYVRHLSPEERAAAQADPHHPLHMLSTRDVEELLRREQPRRARWLHDVDATRYRDGRRMALVDGDGEVDVASTWRAFSQEGYSIRLVHPQQWHQPTFELCSYLQGYFGFPVGCSSYLTPAHTQGFPPHYDDVEIFVLQLEGSKRWRLYARPDGTTAPSPRVTTEFAQAELGEPLAEFVLRPGDTMYFPRGTVHQAFACGSEPSLHLTFSTYQRYAWRDLLAKAVAGSAEGARRLAELVARPGWVHSDLPRDLLGTHTCGQPEAGWRALGSWLRQPRIPMHLTEVLWQDGVLGHAIDALAREFLVNSLPPVLPAAEGEVAQVSAATQVRLRAPFCARLVVGDGGADGAGGRLEDWGALGAAEAGPVLHLHTNVLNGRSFAGDPSPAFEVLPFLASSVLRVLEAPPGEAVCVGDLPGMARGDVAADLLQLLGDLVRYGVLVVVAGA